MSSGANLLPRPFVQPHHESTHLNLDHPTILRTRLSISTRSQPRIQRHGRTPFVNRLFTRLVLTLLLDCSQSTILAHFTRPRRWVFTALSASQPTRWSSTRRGVVLSQTRVA